ncbi:pyridoxal phosphate-dependent transferase [Phascolomyces articulosus]|uniref:Pyridoxal phosphate-dependent transferase n=1 Tax=Phascolomyces articulosus TaxID=60185 RepID=A0AAD5K3K7_9FUNG|nr:pyridoxal phosphate-dependent transferase [Phascolomyces articulosus]
MPVLDNQFSIFDATPQANSIVFPNNKDLDYEYKRILGTSSFTQTASRLILDQDSSAIRESCTTSVQTVSGTEALHLGALFLAQFYQNSIACYISQPAWANYYISILSTAGLQVKEYPYWNPERRELDYEATMDIMRSRPNDSIFILQTSTHNLTGVDPV